LAIVKSPVFFAARDIATARLGQLGLECCGPISVTGIEGSNVANPVWREMPQKARFMMAGGRDRRDAVVVLGAERGSM